MKTLIYTLSLIALLSSCKNNNSNSTILNSKDYEDKTERINVLENQIKTYSAIIDADFELFNVNGFNNERIIIPGASSIDYKFVIKIDTADISKWTNGMNETTLSENDSSWINSLKEHRKQNWETNSTPQFYINDEKNITVIVFKSEGILFKRVMKL